MAEVIGVDERESLIKSAVLRSIMSPHGQAQRVVSIVKGPCSRYVKPASAWFSRLLQSPVGKMLNKPNRRFPLQSIIFSRFLSLSRASFAPSP
jgi:hypothetical protein